MSEGQGWRPQGGTSAADGGTREMGSPGRRGPLAGDTSEIDTEAASRTIRQDYQTEVLREGAEDRGAVDDFDPDFDGEESGPLGRLLDKLGEYWYWILGVAALVVVAVYVLGGGLFGGSEGGREEAQGQQQAQTGAPADEPQQGSDASASARSGPPKDSGMVFEEPTEKDGVYSLKAGDIAWEGKIEKTETGDLLTLKGSTAAQFKRGVTLPDDGAIMTGVIGRAAPDQPVVHATFHRTTVPDGEHTLGTYTATGDGRVLVEGTYSDLREGEGDTVVRTYREKAPGDDTEQVYAVTYKAPKGTPIPILVGWEPPADEDATATEQQGEGN